MLADADCSGAGSNLLLGGMQRSSLRNLPAHPPEANPTEYNGEFLHFEELERFAVAAAVEKVPQLRIDRRRQAVLDFFEALGNYPEPFHVPGGIAAAFFVAHNGHALAQGRGQLA
jgi:hypothetical protein